MAEDERTIGTLSVTVVDGCDLASECSISIELDAEANGSRTCFGIGVDDPPAYFRVYSNTSYRIGSTFGRPSSEYTNRGDTIEDEYIEFTDWSGSASKPITSIISIDWIGIALGSIDVNPNTTEITVPSKSGDGFGVLKITYTTKFDLWRIKPTCICKLIVYAIGTGACEETNASLSIEFGECEGDGGNDVTLKFKNFKTGDAIEGVLVVVDGVQRGWSNVVGEIYIGYLDAGDHDLIASHPLYSPTGDDLLDNDTFVVSSGGA